MLNYDWIKSDNKTEQSSVNILSQFWIESDHMWSQCFWILKFTYQNYTTFTLYHYIWLPSSGISTWNSYNMAPFVKDWTMLIFHKQHNLTDWSSKDLNVIVRCINHLQQWTCTIPCESGFVLTIRSIGHLFLPVSSFSNTTSPTWKFLLLIFHFCRAWRLWRNSFCQRDQNSPAICCTRLHRLREYRFGLLNTPAVAY